MKNIIINPGIQHYHDDEFTNDRVEILEFPYMKVFGDFRIFNGIPIELVDDFIGRLREVMIDVKQAHLMYKDYWETHPNMDTKE